MWLKGKGVWLKGKGVWLKGKGAWLKGKGAWQYALVLFTLIAFNLTSVD